MFNDFEPKRESKWFDWIVVGWGKWMVWLILCAGLAPALESDGQAGTYYVVFWIAWSVLTAICQAIFSGRPGRL